jgi:DNA-binding MarR family transcriptional regulator
VLSSLSMSDGRMLRMSALADLVHGSLSRLSNVVKRLEQQQLVRREPDPVDGRFTVAILTDAGWDKVVASAPGHVDAVRHLVLGPLTAAQVRQLAEIGRRINAQLVRRA